MISLGIDTSNYATSMALVQCPRLEVVSMKKQLLPVKDGALGLRQSDAVFQHILALPAMGESLRAGLAEGGLSVVGVSEKPRPAKGSYMPCFLAGVNYASGAALAAKVPMVKTSHQQGHIAAALYGAGFPLGAGGPQRGLEKTLVFHVSGGTTELLLTQGYTVLRKMGESRDLYAGQAIDRLGVRLGFSFPAGAALSALAQECADEMQPSFTVRGADCHFSGLENQCAALLEAGKEPAYVAKYCLLAVANTLCAMAKAARQVCGPLPLICAGGVLSSSVIRTYMAGRLPDVFFVPGEYASDNALGVALIAAVEQKLAAGNEHIRTV